MKIAKACRGAPPGHPLHSVEGFVQTTTIAVVECGVDAQGNRTICCVERPHPVADTPPEEFLCLNKTERVTAMRTRSNLKTRNAT